MLKVSEKKLAFAGPWVTDREVEYVAQAAREGWYENCTKYMEGFEEEVRNYLGVKYAIGTNCCTQALHLAAAALGLTKGDEVIVTDHSWVATAYAITYTGATCVFVDIDPVTLCIDPAAIERAVTPATKAIMIVDNFGIPADMDEIRDVANRHNLKIIEDAAPALGASYKGQKCGTFGDIGCISFQGAKIAAASEGGIFVTDDEELYKNAKLLSSMGRTDRCGAFWSDQIGYQYTIGSLPAAMATIQLRRIDELVANKRRIYKSFSDKLSSHPMIEMVREKENTIANYTYPSLFLKDEVKCDGAYVISELKKCNIHGRTGFPPMSTFPLYAAEKRFDNPVARRFFERGVVLPAAHNLTEEDIELICNNVLELINK